MGRLGGHRLRGYRGDGTYLHPLLRTRQAGGRCQGDGQDQDPGHRRGEGFRLAHAPKIGFRLHVSCTGTETANSLSRCVRSSSERDSRSLVLGTTVNSRESENPRRQAVPRDSKSDLPEAYYIIARMFSPLRRTLAEVRAWLSTLRRLGLRVFLALTALQAAIVGVLVAMAEFRKRRQGPWEGFPWEDQPEIELESGGDRLKIYSYGVNLYEAMLDEIEAARQEIFVGTFIWKGDEVGRRFVDALACKAGEGVDVYVVFDGLANMFVPPSFKRFPENIHCLHFRPLSGPAKILNPRNVFRFHRHVMSVDGRVAFLGGYNIGSLYAAGWRDTHVRVRGDAAREVDNAFVDFWNAHCTADLPKLGATGERSWDSAAVFHRNDPYMRIFPIRAMYLEAIDRANEHVYLTHAYFIPDRAMRAGLADAARRGVDVQVLVPEHSNHVTADWLGRRHYHELLEAGVRIFRYRHIMIHSKTATADGLWSTIGSANIDRLSMLGNYELNIEVYSGRLAAQMERMFEMDKTNAEEVTLEEWERRPLPAKVVERTLASLSPLV